MAEQEMVTHVVRHDAGSVEHHLGPQVESEIRALTWSQTTGIILVQTVASNARAAMCMPDLENEEYCSFVNLIQKIWQVQTHGTFKEKQHVRRGKQITS